MVEEEHDAITGEVLPPPEKAADGGALPRPARTFGEFMRMLNNGQFDADVMDDLKDAAAELQDIAASSGGKAKGKLTITIDLEVESDGDGAAFFLRGNHKIALPVAKRGRSVAWVNDQNDFVANKPRQGQLFSQPRDVGGARPVRSV
jgi:hypothetical protein